MNFPVFVQTQTYMCLFTRDMVPFDTYMTLLHVYLGLLQLRTVSLQLRTASFQGVAVSPASAGSYGSFSASRNT